MKNRPPLYGISRLLGIAAPTLLSATLLSAALPSAAIPPASAQSPGSLLIWPVSPVIEGDQPAAALWLENPGKTPITLQVRVYAWAQQNGENVYAAQQDILGTRLSSASRRGSASSYGLRVWCPRQAYRRSPTA